MKLKNNKVFFAQAFHESSDETFEIISQSLAAAGGCIYRLKDLPHETLSPGISPLHRGIEQADLVVCDVSNPSPNLMYEVGLATALNKPLVFLSQHPGDVPACIRSYRVMRLDFSKAAEKNNIVAELSKVFEAALSDPSSHFGKRRSSMERETVFCSYSHHDEAFLHRLLIHLRPLEKRGLLDMWVDTQLRAGDLWKDEISKALARASVAILLVSADFLASDFIVDNELPPLLEKAETEGTRIVPIILKPCRFTRDPNLLKFHAINDPLKPLISLSDAQQEEIYDKVAQLVEGVASIVGKGKGGRGNP